MQASGATPVHSAPAADWLPPSERQIFIEQFQRDLQVFQSFFLLINRSSVIQNIELAWVDVPAPEGERPPRTGTTEALAGACAELLTMAGRIPQPRFCTLINDCGRRKAESCGLSDSAAAEVAGRTGRAHVYRCHFGLTDIAVPVMVNGRHVATLLAGQVLLEQPSREAFTQITRDVARLEYVDLERLEEAYRQVRVVSEEDIRTAVRVLEMLAEFLANSWLRLTLAMQERRRTDRELQLSRKEFFYLALEWSESDLAKMTPEEIAGILDRIGFSRPPNRILVVRAEREQPAAGRSFSLHHSVGVALQAIEELCEKLDNVAAARVSMSSICVFFCDRSAAGERSRDSAAHRLAARILQTVTARCELEARVGVGEAKGDWRGLAESYREACLALVGSETTVASYQRPYVSRKEWPRYTEELCQLIAERELEEARAAVSSLPARIGRELGPGAGELAAAGLFFSSTLESLCVTARKLGCPTRAVAELRDAAHSELTRAKSILEIGEAWRRFGGELVEVVGRLYSGKRQKIADGARRLIERSFECASTRKLSISDVAGQLRVSVSHMSRTFKRETGETFEQYVIARRVEMAKRLLLDPVRNVSEVAQLCGFSDPSYFGRVFRRMTGCSPGRYCADPMRYSGRATVRVEHRERHENADAGSCAGLHSEA